MEYGARDPETMLREDSLLPQEDGNGVFRPTISSLEEEAEPSWPSLPAPEVDIHVEDQRRSTDDNLASKTNQKSQKTATCRRHDQEGATGISDLCKAQPASVNDTCNSHPQAAGITQSDSVLEAGPYPQDQSAIIETGYPTESEDDTGSYGFVPSLQRENELLRCKLECAEQEIYMLRSNEQFLVESLRHKSQECAQVWVEKYHLEQQLEASRAECVIHRQQIDELTDENVSILDELDESNEMMLKVFHPCLHTGPLECANSRSLMYTDQREFLPPKDGGDRNGL